MTTRVFILFLFFCEFCNSQTLIPDAKKVKLAYENLSANSNSIILQQNYVAAFPSDTNTFLAVFQTTKFDQLYLDSDKYIEAFEKCAGTFPTEVIGKCVDIGKNLVWEADAIGHLQHISIALAANHLTTFINKYKTLDNRQQNSLIRFYADVENHNAFEEYQKLIDKLKSVGEMDIAKNFETARENRIKRQDH
ncbi:MAG: hypothetical protein ACO1G5_01870 [Bacteroidota bacterium]